MHPLLRKALLRVTLFHVYGLFVAWIFTVIERRNESSHKRMERMLKELKKEIDAKYNMTFEDFNSFVRRAAAAMEEGDELDWTFLNSCGFVFPAIATIGYGNISPKTKLGQAITIIACTIGIPVMMATLKTTGELVGACIKHVVIKIETVLLKRDEPKDVNTKKFFGACSLMVFLLILSSVSSIYIDKWSFLEGLYVWFISFTTIGLGDYVHLLTTIKEVDRGETPKGYLVMYGVFFMIPYMVGLSLMSCILTCIAESIEKIRDFRDRCWSNAASLTQSFLCRKVANYDLEMVNSKRHCSPQLEMRDS